MAVHYVNNSLVVYIKRATDSLLGTFPCTLNPGFWFTVDISWKAKGSLDVHLNNVLLQGEKRADSRLLRVNKVDYEFRNIVKNFEDFKEKL